MESQAYDTRLLHRHVPTSFLKLSFNLITVLGASRATDRLSNGKTCLQDVRERARHAGQFMKLESSHCAPACKPQLASRGL